LQETQYKLVSLQDIRSELDEREVETWQKLIQVLTHEIMNSVTPIISLSKIIRGLLAAEGDQVRDLAEIDLEDAQDMLDSIVTIESRSKGLLHFVHAYRSLTKIQQARFAPIEPPQLLKRIQTLLGPELVKRNIALHIYPIEEGIVIQADQELIEQVLINLVKNAMEGLEGRPDAKIEFKVSRSQDQRPMIQVIDNGSGINPEYIDKIFIPFFTTKKRGSGIGLSLSRQIMRLHRGSISFHSNLGSGTVFSLIF
jgi:signal transduction histidine kinase